MNKDNIVDLAAKRREKKFDQGVKEFLAGFLGLDETHFDFSGEEDDATTLENFRRLEEESALMKVSPNLNLDGED